MSFLSLFILCFLGIHEQLVLKMRLLVPIVIKLAAVHVILRCYLPLLVFSMLLVHFTGLFSLFKQESFLFLLKAAGLILDNFQLSVENEFLALDFKTLL